MAKSSVYSERHTSRQSQALPTCPPTSSSAQFFTPDRVISPCRIASRRFHRKSAASRVSTIKPVCFTGNNQCSLSIAANFSHRISCWIRMALCTRVRLFNLCLTSCTRFLCHAITRRWTTSPKDGCACPHQRSNVLTEHFCIQLPKRKFGLVYERQWSFGVR